MCLSCGKLDHNKLSYCTDCLFNKSSKKVFLQMTADEAADASDASSVKWRSRHHIASTLRLKSDSDAAADIGMNLTVDKFLMLMRFVM